jgi:hypothetical protein
VNKDLTVADCDRIFGGLNHGCPAEGKLIQYSARSRIVVNNDGIIAASEYQTDFLFL